MMFDLVKPTPKQIEKCRGDNSKKKLIPKDWEKFSSLTTIRSGGEMKKFIVYPYQKLVVDLARKYSNIIILKSRQLGITQCIASKFLHDAIINPAASSILFMRNSQDASAASRRVRQMLTSIDEYAVPDNDNVTYLKIRGGGDIYFKNSGKEGSRSLDSCTGMLFDECAFVPNISEIYAASNPSTALSGNKVQKFVVSTPSSKSGWFWDRLNQDNSTEDIEQLANEVAKGKLSKDLPGVYWFIDKANTCKIIIHFSAHPIYSKIDNYLEYRKEQDGTDEETVQREYNLKFIDSAVAVFNSELIRKGAIGENENVPDKEAEYYAGIDTSTTGNDYCTMSILKYKNGRYSLVYLYRKRQQTSEYHMYQMGEILKVFKPKKIGVEVTGGTGQVYLEQLSRQFKELQFEAIRTTGDSKPVMVTSLVLALEKEILEYPANSPIIDEMLSFRREGRKLEASPGKHDDTVMGVCFALAVSPFTIKEEKSIWNI